MELNRLKFPENTVGEFRMYIKEFDKKSKLIFSEEGA